MGNGELIFLLPSSSIRYIGYINSGNTGIDINGGHGSAVSLQLIGVGKRHCRVLMIPARTRLPLWGNINSDAVRESMVGCPLPPLLQNRACDFHRTRLLSNIILVMDTVF